MVAIPSHVRRDDVRTGIDLDDSSVQCVGQRRNEYAVVRRCSLSVCNDVL